MSFEVCQYWMCEERSLRSFLDKLNGVTSEQIKQMSPEKADPVSQTDDEEFSAIDFSVSGTVAMIPVQGILLQRIPTWLNKYIKAGYVNATGLDVIRRQVQMAADDPAVSEIRLLIHSPGGTVAGTAEAAEAIAKAKTLKPVIAEVETMAASGGYYLASQSTRIETNADAEIGSIGVYSVYYDMSKLYENFGVRAIVISSGDLKGAGVEGSVITEAQVAAVKEIIVDMAAHFVKAVASGRGMELKDIKALADGRVWLAPKAKKLGLIDGIVNQQFINQYSERKSKMEQDEKQIQAAVDQARADGQASAMDRMKSLRAAFADDPEFAMAQFEKGNDVTAAKAEYADVLAAKNKQLSEEKAASEAELEKLRAKKASAGSGRVGAEPLASGDDEVEIDETDGPDEFMQQVAQLEKKGMSRGQAMKRAVALFPEAHAEHLSRRTVSIDIK